MICLCSRFCINGYSKAASFGVSNKLKMNTLQLFKLNSLILHPENKD